MGAEVAPLGLRQQVESLILRLEGDALAEVTRAVRAAEAALAEAVAPLELEMSSVDSELTQASAELERAHSCTEHQTDQPDANVAAAANRVESCLERRADVGRRLELCQRQGELEQRETWQALLDAYGPSVAAVANNSRVHTPAEAQSEPEAQPELPFLALLVEVVQQGPEHGSGTTAIDTCSGLIDEEFTVMSQPGVEGEEAMVVHEVDGRHVALTRCYKPAVLDSFARLPASFSKDKSLLLLRVEVRPREGEGMGLSLTNVNVVGKLAPGSAAAQSGIREGDVVIACDGEYLGSSMLSQVIKRGPLSHSFGVLRSVDGIGASAELAEEADAPLSAGSTVLPGVERAGSDAAVDEGPLGGVNFVQLEPTDGSAITVAWELNAASANLDVSYYQLQWRMVQESPWESTPAASQLAISKVTKKNLQPAGSYQFRVRACDAMGHWLPFTETPVTIRPDGAEATLPPVNHLAHIEALKKQRDELLVECERKVAGARQEFAVELAELDRWKARCEAAEKAIDPAEKERCFLLAKQEARKDVEQEAQVKIAIVMRNAAADIRDKVNAAEARTAATVERAVAETTKRLEEKAAIDKRNALRQMEEAYDARLVALQTRLGAGAQQHAQYLEGRHRDEINLAVKAALLEAERASSQRQARAVEEAVEAAIKETADGHKHALDQLAQQVVSLKRQLQLASRCQSMAEAQNVDEARRHRDELKQAAATAMAEAHAAAERQYKPQIDELRNRIRAQAEAYAESRAKALEFNRMIEEEDTNSNGDVSPGSSVHKSNEEEALAREDKPDTFERMGTASTKSKSRINDSDSESREALKARLTKAKATIKTLEERLEHALQQPQTEANVEAANLISDNLRNACNELADMEEALSIPSLALSCAPVAAAASAFSIAVDWLPPSGACRFHLQWREAGETRWLDSKASEELKTACCTKAALRTLAAYEFRVRAANAQGDWGPWSDVSQQTTPSLTLDKAPSRPLTKLLSGGRVKVSWAPPKVASTVLRYELQWKEVSSSCWEGSDTITVTQSDYVASGFYHLSAAYTFRVRAELKTQPVARWTEFGPPSAPVQPTVVQALPAPSMRSSRQAGDMRRPIEQQQPKALHLKQGAALTPSGNRALALDD